MHRYASTLTALGYLERTTARKYRLALGAIDWDGHLERDRAVQARRARAYTSWLSEAATQPTRACWMIPRSC